MVDGAIARVEVIAEDFENGEAQSQLLMINGSLSSKVTSEDKLMFPYIRYINKVYIDTLPKDKIYHILVLGAGGFVLGINDQRNDYTYIDVVWQLPDIYNEHLSKEPLSDNKKFISQDAYLYMLKNKQKYDIIMVDVYSAVRSIPSNFVTEDFFQMVKEHLSPDGMMIANIITSPSFKTKYSKRIDNTLRAVFTDNLSRQVVSDSYFNPYVNELKNIIYVYYNVPQPDNTVYTINKNAAIFGNE